MHPCIVVPVDLLDRLRRLRDIFIGPSQCHSCLVDWAYCNARFLSAFILL